MPPANRSGRSARPLDGSHEPQVVLASLKPWSLWLSFFAEGGGSSGPGERTPARTEKALWGRGGVNGATDAMTIKVTYDGYRNYETYAVAFGLKGEENSYRYWRAVAQEERREATGSRQVREGVWPEKLIAKFRLAERLKEEVIDGAPKFELSLYWDLLNVALTEVDWHEVAETLLEE